MILIRNNEHCFILLDNCVHLRVHWRRVLSQNYKLRNCTSPYHVTTQDGPLLTWNNENIMENKGISINFTYHARFCFKAIQIYYWLYRAHLFVLDLLLENCYAYTYHKDITLQSPAQLYVRTIKPESFNWVRLHGGNY